jgi:hypothetical protein
LRTPAQGWHNPGINEPRITNVEGVPQVDLMNLKRHAAHSIQSCQALRSSFVTGDDRHVADWNRVANRTAWLRKKVPPKFVIFSSALVAASVDGASAVDWALAITDPEQRQSCLLHVVRKWEESDREAAAAYLKGKEAQSQ